MGLHIIPVFIPHQGCPHKCIFCNQHAITGREAITPAQVTSLIEEGLGRKVKPNRERTEIAFYGGTFTGLDREYQEEILSAAEIFCRTGRVHSIRISTRPDYIDDSVIELLQKHQVKTVELGAQSMTDTVLAAAHRGHTKKHTLDSLDLLKKNSFKTGVQVMIGLPGESTQMLFQGIRLLLDNRPNFLRIYPTVVIKKTVLANLFNDGTYRPLDLKQAVELCADVSALCRQKGIPVIRTGLQADRSLQDNVIAGPYHEAFGELVKAELLKRLLLTALHPYKGLNMVHLSISPSAVSLLTGFRRKVLNEISGKTGIGELRIKVDKELAWEEFHVR